MKRSRAGAFAGALALLAAGAAAWGLALREPPQLDVRPLLDLPLELAGWRGTELGTDPISEGMLRADAQLMREYVAPDGERLWAYVGYYGTARGGTPEHVPRACYVAQGWQVDAQGKPPVAPAAQELIVHYGAQQRLVWFWYRSFRRSGLDGLLALRIDHALGQLHAQRADGALVRLSTVVGPEGLDAARQRLARFTPVLEAALDEHWPAEGPGDVAGGGAP